MTVLDPAGIDPRAGSSAVSMEAVVGRTLGELFAERRLKVTEMERRLDLPGGRLEDLVAGRGSLDLDVLRRVLTLLGVAPESFFARVFAQGGGGGNGGGNGDAPAADTPGRHQVAGLLDRVRSALLEIGPEAPRRDG